MHVARCAISGAKDAIGLGNHHTIQLDNILNYNEMITVGKQISKINEIV